MKLSSIINVLVKQGTRLSLVPKYLVQQGRRLAFLRQTPNAKRPPPTAHRQRRRELRRRCLVTAKQQANSRSTSHRVSSWSCLAFGGSVSPWPPATPPGQCVSPLMSDALRSSSPSLLCPALPSGHRRLFHISFCRRTAKGELTSASAPLPDCTRVSTLCALCLGLHVASNLA